MEGNISIKETNTITNKMNTLTISNNNKTNKNCSINLWNQLPRDVGRIICIFLGDVDMLGYLQGISKEWVIFGDELIYRDVATRIYLSQSDKKVINVSKWGSWREMLINRPRVRTNGFYCLRTSYWKPPCNDAFWEERKREFIEVSVFDCSISVIIKNEFQIINLIMFLL